MVPVVKMLYISDSVWFIFHNVHNNKQRQQKSALYKVVGEVA